MKLLTSLGEAGVCYREVSTFFAIKETLCSLTVSTVTLLSTQSQVYVLNIGLWNEQRVGYYDTLAWK